MSFRFRSHPIQAITIVAFAGGGLAILIGDEFSLPPLTAVGAVTFSMAPAALGLRAVATGRIRVPLDGRGGPEELYRGLGARAWGVLLLLMSVAGIAYGVWQLGGLDDVAADLLDRWPGLAAIAAGLLLALLGAAQAGSATVLLRGKEQKVTRWPERIGGVVTSLLGLAFIAAGLLHAASPVLFEKLKDLLARAFLAVLNR